jgi:hypothetical protein
LTPSYPCCFGLSLWFIVKYFTILSPRSPKLCGRPVAWRPRVFLARNSALITVFVPKRRFVVWRQLRGSVPEFFP